MTECPECSKQFKGNQCSCGYKPVVSEEAKGRYAAMRAESIGHADLSEAQPMLKVLNSVPVRGLHRWAYEIVELHEAGIYKGGSVQVEEARSMIALWEGKPVGMRDAA